MLRGNPFPHKRQGLFKVRKNHGGSNKLLVFERPNPEVPEDEHKSHDKNQNSKRGTWNGHKEKFPVFGGSSHVLIDNSFIKSGGNNRTAGKHVFP